MRIGRLTAMVLGGSWLLSSCSGASGPDIIEHDGVKIIVAGESDGGMDARLTGRLAVVEGGCLGVNAEGTDYLVAWPPGVEVDKDSPLSLKVGSRTYSLGDDIDISGGSVDITTTNGLPEVPEECSEDEVFVANED